jgi:peptide deformylase
MSLIDIDKCDLICYPSPLLTRRAEPVQEIDDNLRQCVDKMRVIMAEKKGIGLAAPQVGVLLRFFLICLDGDAESVRVYINPQLTLGDSIETMEEGCLSVPDVFTKIRRYKTCEVTALDLQGQRFTGAADGLYARCLQHEYDHLEGITLVNRMGPTARIVHRRQLKKLEEEA